MIRPPKKGRLEALQPKFLYISFKKRWTSTDKPPLKGGKDWGFTIYEWRMTNDDLGNLRAGARSSDASAAAVGEIDGGQWFERSVESGADTQGDFRFGKNARLRSAGTRASAHSLQVVIRKSSFVNNQRFALNNAPLTPCWGRFFLGQMWFEAHPSQEN